MLSGLSVGLSVKNGRQRAKLSKSTYYLWRSEDAAFDRGRRETIDDGVDNLEDEAYRRAMVGSDLMLIFLLKGK